MEEGDSKEFLTKSKEDGILEKGEEKGEEEDIKRKEDR